MSNGSATGDLYSSIPPLPRPEGWQEISACLDRIVAADGNGFDPGDARRLFDLVPESASPMAEYIAVRQVPAGTWSLARKKYRRRTEIIFRDYLDPPMTDRRTGCLTFIDGEPVDLQIHRLIRLDLVVFALSFGWWSRWKKPLARKARN